MIIPAGYGLVSHIFSHLGVSREMAVTYGVEFVGTQFLQTRAASLHDAFADTIVTQLGSQVQLERTLIKAGPNSTGPSVEYIEPRTGGQAAPGATPQVAYLIKKSTSMGGRRNRGRWYLPGVSEGYVSEAGIVASGTLAGMVTACDTFLARIDTEESPMVILHSQSSDPTSVVELAPDNRVATQRRRLR